MEGDKLTPIEENDEGDWFYGFTSGAGKKVRVKVNPPPGEEDLIQFTRQYKYGPGHSFKRTVTYITKIRPQEEHLKKLRLVHYSGVECGGQKNQRQHGNAIKVCNNEQVSLASSMPQEVATMCLWQCAQNESLSDYR